MAPHLRSTHARERRAIVEAGFPVNTRGLPALPAELLLEITSQTAAAPIPNHIPQPLSVKYLERTTALRALSQLCRSLRSALLPVLWERIEACTTTSVTRGDHRRRMPRWQKDIAVDLVAQLETVTIREPSLASYVKIVNALISPDSADAVLVELARCMALMKNLHTVQILCYHDVIRLPGRRGIVTMSCLYKDAFAGHRFPSVRRIAFSTLEVALFPCFPEVNRVHMTLPSNIFTWDYDNYKAWILKHMRELVSHCHKVHVLEWNVERNMPWTVKKEIYDMLPSLRQVQIYTECDTIDSIKTLSALKHLDTIVLTVSDNDEVQTRKEVEQMVLAAQAILTASPSIERKNLVIKQPHTTEIIQDF